jgi:hypothetical protein
MGEMQEIEFLRLLGDDFERAPLREHVRPSWIRPVVVALALAALPAGGIIGSSLLGQAPESLSRADGGTTIPPRDVALPGTGPGLMHIFDPAQPLLSPGVQTTIDEAGAQVGYALFRPTDEAPTQVWVSAEVGEAGLRYGTDLVILYARWPSGANVQERYEQMAEDWRAGYVTTINGNPAWVVPAGSAGSSSDGVAPGAGPASESPLVSVVHLTVGDVELTLFGKMPLTDLLATAATVA